MNLGSSSSIAPISFENLLRILPEGFVSKNLMAPRRMEENMLLCSLIDDLIVTLTNMMDLISVMNMQQNINTP